MSDYPIEILNLTLRTQNCLRRAGIKYVSEITSKTKSELMKYRSFGECMYNEVQEKLHLFDPNLDIQKLIHEEYKIITNEPYFSFLKENLYGEKYSTIARKNNTYSQAIILRIYKMKKKVIDYIIKTKLMDYYDSSTKTLQIELEDSKWLVLFIEEIASSHGKKFLVR